jgi:hypothetical protein
MICKLRPERERRDKGKGKRRNDPQVDHRLTPTMANTERKDMPPFLFY